MGEPLGLSTCKPIGRESVKFTPVREVKVLGLVRLKVRLVEEGIPSVYSVVVPKVLAMTGGVTTVRLETP